MTTADRRVDTVDGDDPIVTGAPIALSTSRYPTGWFQIAWSHELNVESSKLVKYFGEDMVVWRSRSGQINVVAAYCLHLGANLGVKGRVEGEDIVCPWHEWKWNGRGENTDIPYSRQDCKKHLRLKTWPVVEKYGCIFIWHDLEGREPSWELPTIERLEDSGFYPVQDWMRDQHRVKAHPQLVFENGVDQAHIGPIHGAGEMPQIVEVTADGHKWVTRIATSYGAGKEKTWMTPDGAVSATLEFKLWGIGLGVSEWPDELGSLIMYLSTTPVDETYSDIWLMLTARNHSPETNEPPKGVRKLIEHQKDIVTQDFFVWENMKVLTVPNFAAEEAKHYGAMRRWAQQFYPDTRERIEGSR